MNRFGRMSKGRSLLRCPSTAEPAEAARGRAYFWPLEGEDDSPAREVDRRPGIEDAADCFECLRDLEEADVRSRCRAPRLVLPELKKVAGEQASA